MINMNVTPVTTTATKNISGTGSKSPSINIKTENPFDPANYNCTPEFAEDNFVKTVCEPKISGDPHITVNADGAEEIETPEITITNPFDPANYNCTPEFAEDNFVKIVCDPEISGDPHITVNADGTKEIDS